MIAKRGPFCIMRKILAPVLLMLTATALLTGCKKDTNSSLTPVTLNEVAHSIFYAPQYAAIELGYFEDEGIDLTLVNLSLIHIWHSRSRETFRRYLLVLTFRLVSSPQAVSSGCPVT